MNAISRTRLRQGYSILLLFVAIIGIAERGSGINPQPCCECERRVNVYYCEIKPEYIPYKPIGPVSGSSFQFQPNWAAQLANLMAALEKSYITVDSPPSYTGSSVRDYRDYCCPNSDKSICVGPFRLDKKTKYASGNLTASKGASWTDCLSWGVGYAMNLIPVIFPNGGADEFVTWLQGLASMTTASLSASGYTSQNERTYQELCAGCGTSQTSVTGTESVYAGGTIGEFSFGGFFYLVCFNGWFQQTENQYIVHVGPQTTNFKIIRERTRSYAYFSYVQIGSEAAYADWSTPQMTFTAPMDPAEIPICIGGQYY